MSTAKKVLIGLIGVVAAVIVGAMVFRNIPTVWNGFAKYVNEKASQITGSDVELLNTDESVKDDDKNGGVASNAE